MGFNYVKDWFPELRDLNPLKLLGGSTSNKTYEPKHFEVLSWCNFPFINSSCRFWVISGVLAWDEGHDSNSNPQSTKTTPDYENKSLGFDADGQHLIQDWPLICGPCPPWFNSPALHGLLCQGAEMYRIKLCLEAFQCKETVMRYSPIKCQVC